MDQRAGNWRNLQNSFSGPGRDDQIPFGDDIIPFSSVHRSSAGCCRNPFSLSNCQNPPAFSLARSPSTWRSAELTPRAQGRLSPQSSTLRLRPEGSPLNMKPIFPTRTIDNCPPLQNEANLEPSLVSTPKVAAVFVARKKVGDPFDLHLSLIRLRRNP